MVNPSCIVFLASFTIDLCGNLYVFTTLSFLQIESYMIRFLACFDIDFVLKCEPMGFNLGLHGLVVQCHVCGFFLAEVPTRFDP